jgi:uncharacterized membrane protein YbhN (UPF0104 family)
MMFNNVLPGGLGGDGYRMLLLNKRYQFPKLKSLRVMLYERVSGFYILVLLGFMILPFTHFFIINSTVKWLGISCLILVTPCYFWGVKFVLKDNLQTALHAAKYSFAVQLLQIASVIAVIYGIDQSVSYAMLKNYMLLFVIASIVTILPISIGPIGLREATFLYGLPLIGCADTTYGVAIAMFISLTAIIIGALGAVIWVLEFK